MWSSRVVRASDCQCQSRNNPGFHSSILLHSGIWRAADEEVLNKVRNFAEIKRPFCEVWETSRTTIKHQIQRLRAQLTELKQIRKYLRCVYLYCRLHWYGGVTVLLTGRLLRSRSGLPCKNPPLSRQWICVRTFKLYDVWPLETLIWKSQVRVPWGGGGGGMGKFFNECPRDPTKIAVTTPSLQPH